MKEAQKHTLHKNKPAITGVSAKLKIGTLQIAINKSKAFTIFSCILWVLERALGL